MKESEWIQIGGQHCLNTGQGQGPDKRHFVAGRRVWLKHRYRNFITGGDINNLGLQPQQKGLRKSILALLTVLKENTDSYHGCSPESSNKFGICGIQPSSRGVTKHINWLCAKQPCPELPQAWEVFTDADSLLAQLSVQGCTGCQRRTMVRVF